MWIEKVVKAAEQREMVNGIRVRRLHSLSDSIISAKSRGINPIIAELKMASPSGFNSNIDANTYVKFMELAGATALSVITEPLYFNGSYSLLRDASSIVNMPILMKDFVVTEGQVHDAYVLGADAILLILNIIKDEGRLRDLYRSAISLGMESIVEIHNEDDLNRALNLKPRIVGVNARNLNTLNMDFELQERILSNLPDTIIKIAESGIESVSRLKRLKSLGADGFLIGTGLMEDPHLIFNFVKGFEA